MRGFDSVEEVPWLLLANGTHVSAGTASPGHWDALAAGRLLADGFLVIPTDLLELHVATPAGRAVRLEARVPELRFERAMAELHHRTDHGCGLLHFVNCEADALRRTRAVALPDATTTADQLRALFAACDEFSPAGGVHGAALHAGPQPSAALAVDVSRQSAVERVLGGAFLAGLDLSGHGLVLTARISGHIALAAARAGVAWVASRSVATSLAVSLSAAAELPLITRAAGRDRHVTGMTGGA
jgi:FdhD protein